MNIRFDCPVLDDNTKKKIVATNPEVGDAIVMVLAQCPPEMTVLSLVDGIMQECVSEVQECISDISECVDSIQECISKKGLAK